MTIFRRLKNLWDLGAYRVGKDGFEALGLNHTLVKDFPTIKKKLASIIEEDKPDVFTQEKNAQRNTL